MTQGLKHAAAGMLFVSWVFVSLGATQGQRVPPSEKPELDKKCTQIGEQKRSESLQADPWRARELQFAKKNVFYSQRLETCVEAEENVLEDLFLISDISRKFLKRDSISLGYATLLFSCAKDGVSNVLLAKVEKHDGDVSDLPYTEYMDDFNGGPPATVKPAEKRFTRKQCKELFHRKLKELR